MHLKQVTQSWTASPVSFLRPAFLARREWPEYPGPRFMLTLGIVVFGCLAFLMGLAGLLSGPTAVVPSMMLSTPSRADTLSGRNAAGVRAMFGPPAMVRHEPPAEIWQYRAEDCVLDLFVYDGNIQHAEIRPRSGTDMSAGFEDACLAALRLNAGR